MKWKLVPVEPTEEMEDALWVAMFEEPREVSPLAYAGITAMLAASPPASQDEELVEKVARAAYRAWDCHHAHAREEWREVARAVLKMLEGRPRGGETLAR